VIGTAVHGASPYRTCITHGFILDDKGRAMSKSAGNVIEPEAIVSQQGAEILRLWTSMLNYKEDAPFGEEILQRTVEAYRKIRNTWRFLLGNLHDFDPDRQAVPEADLESLDRWALGVSAGVAAKMLKGYGDYEYHTVFHALYNFFTVDLSAFYLDIVKDRMYCSGKTSRLRRSGQTAMFRILSDTLRLMAPILPFTAEEAWDVLPAFRGKEESVHLTSFPAVDGAVVLGEAEKAEWKSLIALRERVLKELEIAREGKLLGTSLEAQVTLRVPPAARPLLAKHRESLAALFIVSDVVLASGDGPEIGVAVGKAPGGKCVRCWTYSTHVGTSAGHPDLCARCEGVVRDLGR